MEFEGLVDEEESFDVALKRETVGAGSVHELFCKENAYWLEGYFID